MIDYIPIYHQQSGLHKLERNQRLNLQIPYSCNAPSRYLVVDWAGNCFVCPCEAWMPVSVGNIDQFTDLQQVWQSPAAQAVQQDIAAGKYTWCAVNMCGVTHNNIEYDRYTISINIDESCNLHCPSCRSEKIMLTSGPEFDLKLQRAQHIVSLLEQFDQPCHIIMSGNGDVLASNVMRPIIHNFQPRPNQTFRLFTNGLLLQKQLERSKILPQITEYQISIDAGSADVYEKVRLGGKWSVLMQNFDFLKEVADRYGSQVWLMFVLQKNNWRDLENFAELCERYQWTGNVTQLVDWGTWLDFDQHNVIGNTNHAERSAAIAMLQNLRSQQRPFLNFDSTLSTIT